MSKSSAGAWISQGHNTTLGNATTGSGCEAFFLSLSMQKVLKQASKSLGTEVAVKEFVRLEVGEGMDR